MLRIREKLGKKEERGLASYMKKNSTSLAPGGAGTPPMGIPLSVQKNLIILTAKKWKSLTAAIGGTTQGIGWQAFFS